MFERLDESYDASTQQVVVYRLKHCDPTDLPDLIEDPATHEDQDSVGELDPFDEGEGNTEAAAEDANRILDEEISRYLNIERAKQVAPLITALRENANSVRAEILAQAQKRLAKGADGQEVLEYATAALMKKMLHNPSVKLREAGENSDAEIIAAARALFGLEEK